MFVINNEYEAENLIIYIENHNLLNSQGSFNYNFVFN